MVSMVVLLDFVVLLEYCSVAYVISWNIKGSGCPLKRSYIHDFLKIYCIDIVLIQESKALFPSDSFFRSLGGSFINGWSHLNSNGASGGQIIGWRDNIIEYSDELIGEFLLSVRLTHRRTRQDFVVISIYEPCSEWRQVDLWHELSNTRGWAIAHGW